MLDQINRINLLYDIYGPLLTGRQQEVLLLYFSDNLSMGEIAAEYGNSRQAVYDLIRRALAAMEAFESKLGLYSLFHYQQERLQEADRILKQPVPMKQDLERLRELVRELRQKNEQ
ncbi:MAG: YlxM family DNA-binding protein [Bacillota bacterium]